jgi:CBS domain containing-hemolysin-like protein
MLYLTFTCVILSSLASFFFSALNYSLREFSRTRLEEALTKRNKSSWFDRTLADSNELIFTTAVGRMICSLLLLITVLHLFHNSSLAAGWQYLLAVIITALISLNCSVAFPHAISQHAGERVIATFISFIHGWRRMLAPALALMRGVDSLVAKAANPAQSPERDAKLQQDIREEIVSAVEEGEAEGVVDEAEKEMIRSVIEFKDTTTGQIMTPRPEIVGVEAIAKLEEIKQLLEESGHSRVPVYEGSIDHVIGILYARDLLKHLGTPADQFDVRKAVRQPFYVPESKPLRDLLNDFRLQKIHIAIVLDEYGGTAGLVTIEDVLEELVGEISDEHEPLEPAMLKKINDQLAEADARIRIDELNRLMSLNLPEDAGYETLSGFLSSAMGKIPALGAVYNHPVAKFTVIDAEPQRVNRVKIEVS